MLTERVWLSLLDWICNEYSLSEQEKNAFVAKFPKPDVITNNIQVAKKIYRGDSCSFESARKQIYNVYIKIGKTSKKPQGFPEFEMRAGSTNLKKEKACQKWIEEQFFNSRFQQWYRKRFDFGASNKTQQHEIIAALRSLNYSQQKRHFHDWKKKHKTGTFIIQGNPKQLRRWLTNSLIEQFFPYVTTNQNIKINLPKPGDYQDIFIDEVWKQLKAKLNLPYQADNYNCIEKAFQYWQQGSLIICIHDLKFLPRSEVKQFIEQFWLPLVEKIQNSNLKHIESYVLLFCLDCVDNIQEWAKECTTEALSGWQPEIPLYMTLENFQSDDIKDWLDCNRKLIQVWEPAPVQPIAANIWEESAYGVPELAIQGILQELSQKYESLPCELKDFKKF